MMTVTRTITTAGLEYRLVHGMADDARQHDDEGIDHALYQGQGNHIAIGDMADLMPEHGLDLIPLHGLQ